MNGFLITPEQMNAKEIAACIGINKRSIERRAVKELWKYNEATGRGGKCKLYNLFNLPKDIQLAINKHTAKSVKKSDIEKKEAVIAQVELQNPGHLKNWQREKAQARLSICRIVLRLAKEIGKDAAVLKVIQLAEDEIDSINEIDLEDAELAERIKKLAKIANAKKGEERTLSRTSIYRWMKEVNAAGSTIARLAPKEPKVNRIPVWAEDLRKLYGKPQKPSLAYCVEKLAETLPVGIIPPSYNAVYRFVKKMSNVDKHRGRMGSREIKKLLPFVRRDTNGMSPTDCYIADGHTFDAEVAHPAHGKPFRPEITTILDVFTRKAVGWSVELAESTWAVMDAIRHACETCGIPAIFYTDRGPGYKNSTVNEFLERIGTELSHSLPYNSQARGIIERSHRSIWVKAAKMLSTYMGEQMDEQAKQKVFKITRNEIRISGKSKSLLDWEVFMVFCQKQIDDYNNRPHSSLPKIRAADGTKRNQTPNEAWAQAVTEGFEPIEIDAIDRGDLFRPYKTCKIIRGEIRLFNNLYFSHDLVHHHGETAQVGYDIHDASRVWVRERATGRLICVAEFEANKRSYMPESVKEQAKYRRMQAKLKRLDAKREEAEQELNPPQLIEYQPVMELPSMSIEQPEEIRVEAASTVQTQPVDVSPIIKRPMFDTTIQKFRWLMNNKSTWDATDAKFLMKYVDGHQYFDMLAIYTFEGIGWTKPDEEKAKELIRQEEGAQDRENVAAQ